MRMFKCNTFMDINLIDYFAYLYRTIIIIIHTNMQLHKLDTYNTHKLYMIIK